MPTNFTCAFYCKEDMLFIVTVKMSCYYCNINKKNVNCIYFQCSFVNFFFFFWKDIQYSKNKIGPVKFFCEH